MSLPENGRSHTLLKNTKLGFLLAVIAALSMWFYVQRILIPYQEADAAAHSQPRGILSDLYPRWIGARDLLLRGMNPYSDAVTREIQRGYYGRELDPHRVSDPKDEQRFAYPVYVVFLLAPTVSLPFPLVRTAFTILLVALTAASVVLWIKSLRWNPSWIVTASWMVLTLGSFPVAQGIKLQQLSLLVAALLSASAAAAATGFLVSGGFLLALATIKPQLAWLPVALLMLWVLRDWRRRQRLFWGFSVTMFLLLTSSQCVLPGWIGNFVDAVDAYHRYTQNVSILGLLLTPTIGNVASVLLVALTLCKTWSHLGQNQESFPARGFATVMALTVLIAPMFAPYNQLLLLPATMVLAREARQLWKAKPLTRILLILASAALIWPWLAALVLDLSPRAAAIRGWNLPLYTTFVIPVVIFALIATWRDENPLAPGSQEVPAN